MKLPLVQFVLYTIFSISLCYSMEQKQKKSLNLELEEVMLQSDFLPVRMYKPYFYIDASSPIPSSAEQIPIYFAIKKTETSIDLAAYLQLPKEPLSKEPIVISDNVREEWMEQIRPRKQQSESIILASLRSEIKEAESEIEKNTTVCNILKQKLDTSAKQAIKSQHRLEKLNKTIIEEEDRLLELSNEKIAIISESITLHTQNKKSIAHLIEIQRKLVKKKKLSALKEKKNNQQDIKSDPKPTSSKCNCSFCNCPLNQININISFANTFPLHLEKTNKLCTIMNATNQDDLISKLCAKAKEHFQKTILSNNECFNKANHLLIGEMDDQWSYIFSPCRRQLAVIRINYPCTFEQLQRESLIPHDFLCKKPCNILQK